MKKVLCPIAVFALMFFSLLSCKKEARTIPKEAQRGGVLLIGTTDEPSHLNPLFPSYGKEDNPFFDLLFLPLLRIEKGEVVPALAESWEYSEDLKSITFYLRKNLKWQDGTPLTTDDIQFTFDIIQSKGFDSPLKSQFRFIKKMEVIDKYTFKFIFDRIYLYELLDCKFYPVPKHILEKEKDIKNSQFNFAPVGCGPFTVKKWIKGDLLELVRNKNYIRETPLSGIIFKFYDNSYTVVLAYEQNRIDIAIGITPDDIQYLKEKKIPFYITQGNKVTFLGWNTQKEPFKNKEVRKAIGMLLNKKEWLKNTFSNVGEIALSPIPSTVWAFDSSMKEISYNPKEGIKLLEDIGFKDINNDKFLEYNKKNFSIALLVDSGNPFHLKIAELLKRDIEKNGIKVEINSMSAKEFIENLTKKNFDAYILSWTVNEKVDLTPLWHSDRTKGIFNFTGFYNKEVDSLLESAILTINQKKSKRAFSIFQKILHQENPALFLFVEGKIIGVKERVKNITNYLYSPIANLDLVYIPQNMQEKEIAFEIATMEKIPEQETEEEKPLLPSLEKKTPAVKEPEPSPPKATAEEILAKELAKKQEQEARKKKEEKTPVVASEEIVKKIEETPPLPLKEISPPPEPVVTEPKILKKVSPIYPEEAKKLGLHGMVFIRVLIGKDGKVKRAEVLKSSKIPILDESALEAAKKWEFEPARQNGNPIESFTTLPFKF